MPVKTYKEKAPQLQAVELTNVLSQAEEIANLIGATSIGIDLPGKKLQLKIDDAEYSVVQGQVIAIKDGEVLVQDAADFYSKYEVV